MALLPLVDFRVVWRPFELAPSSGAGRVVRKHDAYMSFMGNAHRVYQYFSRLREEGQRTGIAFEFEGSTSATFDAHRLAEWALAVHGEDKQDALVAAQFSQYMERGQPPNAIDAQVAAAVAAGMSASEARAVLEDKRAFAEQTTKRLAEARAAGVNSVPCFRVAGKEVATGAQSPEYWEDVLRRLLLERHQEASAVS